MTESSPVDVGKMEESRLPRRDWILLPAIGLLTICILSGSTELIARKSFPSMGGIDDCLVKNDPSTGVRGIPNSVCKQKMAEGPPMEYRFNSCGHVAGMECGPKPASTYRIVMVGTSLALGMGVPREKTFAALLPAELSRRSGRKIEVYNESIPLRSPRNIVMNFNDVLAAKPDMILWVLSNWDIKNESLVLPRDEILGEESPQIAEKATALAPPVFPSKAWWSEQAEQAEQSTLRATRDSWHETNSFVLLNHLMFRFGSQSQYLKRCNIWQDDRGYLGAEPSQTRLRHLADLDTDVAEIEARASSAGVPLVAVFVPLAQHAALLSTGKWPADIDPFNLDNELRLIIASHGGTYLDILPDFRNLPNPERGYFPADGHPDEEGHATISRLLVNKLTSGAVPAFSVGAGQLH